MKYRADIDGLRAFAIIPVVLYHAGITMFSGGFIGVDIFFVISGYLITTIILNDIDKGKFTITSFYFRRIKRIFPALYFFIAVMTVVCWYLYLPKDFESYGKSIYYSAIFISNIFFKRQSGYFDTEAELKPLLHTWSLSVEEQFYIFYPILLIILAKYFNKKYKLTVISIFIASACLCFFGTTKMPEAAFFLLPFRAWELMLGAMIALGVFSQVRNKIAINLLAFIGLGMILTSIFIFDHSTIFPGYAALLPVVGTALVIYAGQNNNETIVGRFISLKPFVYIGLISYSWYLWHWGVFAVKNYFKDIMVESFVNSNLFLILLTLLLAIFSYYLIEKPFRDVKWESRKKLFAYAGAVMAVFIGLGYAIKGFEGFKDRFSDEVVAINETVEDNWREKYKTSKGVEYIQKKRYFQLGDKKTQPTFVLWGDSHAWAVAPGLDYLAQKEGKSGYLFAQNATMPLLQLVSFYPEHKDFQDKYAAEVLKVILSMENIDTVVLAARWPSYLNKSFLYFNENGANRKVSDTQVIVDRVEKLLAELISELNKNNKRVVVFSSLPEGKSSVPGMIAKSMFFESKFPTLYKGSVISQSIDDFNQMQKSSFGIFDRLKADKNLDFDIVYLHKALCYEDNCNLANEDSIPYFYDDDHLSTFGAKYICEELKDELIPIL